MKKMLRKMAGFFSRRTRKRNLYSSRSGAVSMEYLLIGALVSVVLIIAAMKFGGKILDEIKGAGDDISNEMEILVEKANQIGG